MAESDITQMAGIITAAGVLVAYIFGEAIPDAASAGNSEKDGNEASDDGIGGSSSVAIGFDYMGDDVG